MLTFYEFINVRRKPSLPDPVTMLASLGISLDGPHEIEVQKMVKAMKRADDRAPMRAAAGDAPSRRLRG